VLNKIMNDRPKRGLQLPNLNCRGRFFAASLLVAALVLAGIACFRFDDRQPNEKAPHIRTASPSDSVVLPLVTPVQYELDEGARGSVITASGTLVSPSPRQSADPAEVENSAGDPGHKSADDRFRAAIVGQWEDEYRGKRRLTVRDDGTGLMVVEPDGIGKRLFAAELTFDIEWVLADGRVTMKMLRGEPKAKVQLILKLYGQEAEYTILEMTDERMLLQDPDGKTRYDWRRPASRGDASKPGPD
jgi:hypothetical protein